MIEISELVLLGSIRNKRRQVRRLCVFATVVELLSDVVVM